MSIQFGFVGCAWVFHVHIVKQCGSKVKICYLFRVCCKHETAERQNKEEFSFMLLSLGWKRCERCLSFIWLGKAGKLLTVRFTSAKNAERWILASAELCCRSNAGRGAMIVSLTDLPIITNVCLKLLWKAQLFIILYPWNLKLTQKFLSIRIKAHLEVYDANKNGKTWKNGNRSSMKKTLFKFYSIAIDR